MRRRAKFGVLGLAAVVAGFALTPTRPATSAPVREGLEIGHLGEEHFAPAVAQAMDFMALAPAAATPGTLFAGFNPVTPERVLETRPGHPGFSGVTALGPDAAFEVQIAGRAGVPADAGSVVLNVTVTNPSLGGYLTVWPTGAARPDTSSVNMLAGQTVPNAVVVKLGTSGRVSVYNNAGTSDVLIDVVGWAREDGHFIGLTPSRILDTRPGVPIGAGATLTFAVSGRSGVPATGVSAVVLNVTATQPTASSFLTVWPTGSPQPNASSLNMAAGQTVPNLVYASLGTDGKVSIFNEAGTSHLLADVVGYIPTGAAFIPVNPTRVMDTRLGTGVYGVPVGSSSALVKPAGKIGFRQSVNLDVNAVLDDRYPRLTASTVQAFVFNVTAVEATDAGFLTLSPAGEPTPNTSNLNMVPGRIAANAVVVKAGTGNRVSIYNAEGATHVIVDLVGFVPRRNGSDGPDGVGGSKYHVVYVQGNDSNTDPGFVNNAMGNIRTEVAALTEWFASQTGRNLNIDREDDQIEVSYIRYTRFTRSQLVNWEQDFTSSVFTQLIDDGFGSTFGRLWLVYFDGNRTDGVCGIAAIQFTTVFMQSACGAVTGSIPAAIVGNSANTAQVALHEMLHGLGAANPCSPNYDRTDANNDGRPDRPGHVSDDDNAFNGSDLMYWNTGRQPKSIDVEGDDYFGRSGSNPCINIGNSPFVGQ